MDSSQLAEIANVVHAKVKGSSFYVALRILPTAQREAMFAIYSFCRDVDDVADEPGPKDARRAELENWREDIDAVYRGKTTHRTQGLLGPTRQFGLKREDYIAVIDGMEMDLAGQMRAPDMATLDLYCDRVASAVGRLSVRVFGMEENDGIALAYHLGRALQLTNILRDIDEDAEIGRLYLPREALLAAGVVAIDPRQAVSDVRIAAACAPLAAKARGHFREITRDNGAYAEGPGAHAAPHVRGLRFHSDQARTTGLSAAARANTAEQIHDVWPAVALRNRLMREPVVHIVGAGLGGLAAAAKLASTGASVALHEAAGQGGGRCRSYHEPALDMDIDNGNHLVLSGNHATMEYLDLVDAKSQLVGPPEARFDFVDLTTRERWTLRPNSGPLPWWIFSRDRRVPGTNAFNYLQLGSLLFAKKGASIGEAISCSGPLYERLWRPLLLAALNTEPPEASAGLAASVIRETLALGGSACRPLIAANGLSSAFVDPALRMLQSRGAPIRFGQRLREIVV